jgi:hypothetical protein
MADEATDGDEGVAGIWTGKVLYDFGDETAILAYVLPQISRTIHEVI